MKDLTAVKALLDKTLFTKYSSVLLKLDNIQKEIKMVINSIVGYYEAYADKDKLTVDELQTFHNHQNPNPQDPKIYEHIFSVLRSVKIDNPDLLTDILNATVEEHIQSKISLISAQVVDGTKATGINEVRDLIKRYDDIVNRVQGIELDVCTKTLRELIAADSEAGLTWRLNFLNDKFGPLKKKTLGHIFARPDGGKTSMMLSESTFLAQQLNSRPIIFCSNEEDVERVMKRGYCAMNGTSMKWVLEHIDEAEKNWQSCGGNKIRFIREVYHIDKLVESLEYFKPRVVIIDQGPKVAVANKRLEGVARLKELYGQYRDLANKYDCSVISLGQADRGAENKKLLTMTNLDASKTDIPGELDWCLGIGKLEDRGYEEVRWLNVVKNKLTGRYGSKQVMLKIATSRFEDD